MQWTPSQVHRIAAASAGFLLRSIASITAIVGGDVQKAVVFHAIWTSNVKHITYSEDNRKYGNLDAPPPADLLRPISVLAISESLRIPYETARRHVEKLKRDGLCTRESNGGVKIAADFLNKSPERMAIVRGNFASLVLFLTDLRKAGFDFAPYQGEQEQFDSVPLNVRPLPNGRAIMRVCSEFVMRALDAIGRLRGDQLITNLVHLTIWIWNVEKYYSEFPQGDAVPSDHDRRPITVRSLSRKVGLPLETTRRHVQNLHWRGDLRRLGDEGLIVPAAVFQLPQYQDAVFSLAKDTVRLVGDMRRNGLCLDSF
jgi:hypothetical protein